MIIRWWLAFWAHLVRHYRYQKSSLCLWFLTVSPACSLNQDSTPRICFYHFTGISLLEVCFSFPLISFHFLPHFCRSACEHQTFTFRSVNRLRPASFFRFHQQFSNYSFHSLSNSFYSYWNPPSKFKFSLRCEPSRSVGFIISNRLIILLRPFALLMLKLIWPEMLTSREHVGIC